MKLLIDAQLPKRLSAYFKEIGLDSVHTSELKHKNQTTDAEICKLSIREKRIVVTKDIDFYDSYLMKAEPYKLIYLTVGNMSTEAIIKLFKKNKSVIFDEIKRNFVVEISQKNIITII